jgi:hypothetical protein
MRLEESAQQRLASHVVQLNRIDNLLLAAGKTGTPLPSSTEIFTALSDAMIESAEVVDSYRERIPDDVRIGLFRLNCAATDLVASLKHYVSLMVR